MPRGAKKFRVRDFFVYEKPLLPLGGMSSAHFSERCRKGENGSSVYVHTDSSDYQCKPSAMDFSGPHSVFLSRSHSKELVLVALLS